MHEQEPNQGEESSATPPVDETMLRIRLDPRTGRTLTVHKASFWRDHEVRRLAQGLSLLEYANANGLNFPTFRRWSSKLAGRSGQRYVAGGTKTARKRLVEPAPPGEFFAIPLHQSAQKSSASDQARIEVALGAEVRVSLAGAAGARVLEAVLARVQAGR